MKTLFFASLLVVLFNFQTSSFAIDIYDNEQNTNILLGGYIRALSGQHLPSSTVSNVFGELVAPQGINAEVLRAEWRINIGESASFDLHQRLSWSLSAPTLQSVGVGIGVSANPENTVDLSSHLVNETSHQLLHDIDRLAFQYYFNNADLTLGRQGIEWGTVSLFPVANIWSTLSPFELDNTELRGIDSARLIVPIGNNKELDLVLADRGDLNELSAGARINFFLNTGDGFLAVAKSWDELRLLAGYTHLFDSWRVLFEISQPYLYDSQEQEDDFRLPRVTIGSDYFSGDLTASFELHFSGDGTSENNYIPHLDTSTPHQRGETYLWGQFYAGTMLSYKLSELVTLTGTTMANLKDPSFMLAPQLQYNLGPAVDLSAGMFQGFGYGRISITEIENEFGMYGSFYYTRITAYY